MYLFDLQSNLLFWRTAKLLTVTVYVFSLSLFGAAQAVAQTEPLALQPAAQPVDQLVQTESLAKPVAPEIKKLAPETAPETKQTDGFDAIDPQRDYLSGRITSFASYVDRFFGGDRHYQESNESVVQLDLTKIYGYGGDPRYNLEAKLNFKLPVTEGKFRLVVETNPEKNLTTTSQPAGSTVLKDQVAVPKTVGLAARYTIAQESNWHFNTDVGLRMPIPIKPFLRSRASYSVPLGLDWRLTATETGFWFDELGWGETSQFDMERVLNPLELFRASTTVTYLKDKDNFDLSQSFSVYHTLSDRTALLYQASAIGISPDAASEISPTWFGQSATSDNATDTRMTSAATTPAQPIHCSRRWSMIPAAR